MHSVRHVGLALLAACVVTASAHAEPNCGAATATAPAPVQSPTSVGAQLRQPTWKPRAWRPPAVAIAPAPGLRVAIDPIDGSLSMPTEAGSPDAVERERELPPLRSIVHPDGSVQVVLDERFMEFAVASIGPSGRPVWTCVPGASSAGRFLLQSSAAPEPARAPAVKWEDR